MRGREATRRLRDLAERLVQELPAFAGHAGSALQGAAEAVQLARNVVERRLDRAANAATVVREEEIAGGAADDCADDGRRDCPRVVCHARLPRAKSRSGLKVYKL